MRLFRRQSIRGKLALLMAIASAVTMLVAGVTFVANDARMIRAADIRHLTSLAHVLASSTEVATALDQADSNETVWTSLQNHPRVSSACMYDEHGVIRVRYSRDEGIGFPLAKTVRDGYHSTTDGFLDFAVPVIRNKQRQGTVYLSASTFEFHTMFGRYVTVTGAVALVSLLITVVLALALHGMISGPILRLASTAQKISNEGDYTLRVERDVRDEFGALYQAFNCMLDRIDHGDAALKIVHEQLQSTNDQLESRVGQRTRQLSSVNERLLTEVEQREKANCELSQMQDQLMEASRKAGMADVANSVLHNVGNVLNSVNISAAIVSDKTKALRLHGLATANELIDDHRDDLGHFFTQNEKGRLLPAYLNQLSDTLAEQRQAVVQEVVSLRANIEHMKEIVRAQQSYAGKVGVTQPCDLTELMEHALQFVHHSIQQHGIRLERDYDELPAVEVDKAKLLQMLVNLIKNAKESLAEQDVEDKCLRLSVVQMGDDQVCLSVSDSGTGIAAEKLTQIFSHGFTTKRHGHGFGLHASANAASEMGGSLRAESEGLGKGATFTIELPLRVMAGAAETAMVNT